VTLLPTQACSQNLDSIIYTEYRPHTLILNTTDSIHFKAAHCLSPYLHESFGWYSLAHTWKRIFSAVVSRGLVLPSGGLCMNTRCQGCSSAVPDCGSVTVPVYWGRTAPTNPITARVKML